MFEQLTNFFTIEMIYLWLNIGIIPFWLMLIFFPQSKFCGYSSLHHLLASENRDSLCPCHIKVDNGN